ncbi:phage holin family protein [Clostridium sp. MB40-C1]|uniref:phage holin family protein n=1 Tax=Clostridium sp. MB40-C1 TaxID=3070996 RepID=UPI0027DEB47A|nr:phage holin family protein [Clostridium sp. MB40-C1]WMJ81984.1 phage holin family protein [Clostridium sp. MB40-C1]
MDKQNIFNAIVAGAGTVFTGLFGGWDLALQILIIFMILDYTMGVVIAWINKKLSSKTGFKGLLKKSVIFAVLIVAVSLDKLLNTGSWVFRTLVCYFYIANEGISILENCACLGVPIPKQLRDTLAQLKEGNKKEIK